MNGVSIIICCFNSAKRIIETLKHLATQKIKTSIELELIIVDNNCTDNTVELSEITWKALSSPYQLKIVKETTSGLSYARYKGIQTAKYEYLIFCDDDNWLCENYIESIYQILSKNKTIGAVCGYNSPISEVEFPNWFSTYQRYYAVGVPNLDAGNITHKGWIWGAGMGLRKTLLINLYNAGFKNLTSDRKGKELSTGGDIELCKWIILSNHILWYSDDLQLQHYIPQERLSKSYLSKLMMENEKINTLMATYDFLIKERNKSVYSIPYLLKFILKLPYKLMFNKLSSTERFTLNKLTYKLGIQSDSFYFKIRKSLETYDLIVGHSKMYH